MRFLVDAQLPPALAKCLTVACPVVWRITAIARGRRA